MLPNYMLSVSVKYCIYTQSLIEDEYFARPTTIEAIASNSTGWKVGTVSVVVQELVMMQHGLNGKHCTTRPEIYPHG